MKTFFTVSGVLLIYGALLMLLGTLVMSVVKTAISIPLTSGF